MKKDISDSCDRSQNHETGVQVMFLFSHWKKNIFQLLIVNNRKCLRNVFPPKRKQENILRIGNINLWKKCNFTEMWDNRWNQVTTEVTENFRKKFCTFRQSPHQMFFIDKYNYSTLKVTELFSTARSVEPMTKVVI